MTFQPRDHAGGFVGLDHLSISFPHANAADTPRSYGASVPLGESISQVGDFEPNARRWTGTASAA